MTKVMTSLNKNINRGNVSKVNKRRVQRGVNLLTTLELKNIKSDEYFQEIRKVKESNGEYKSEKIASGELKRVYSDGLGLHLLLKSEKSKLWEFNFISPLTGKRRKTSFGTYPDVSLSDAREKRQEYRDLVAAGIDPIEQKKQKRIEQRNEEFGSFDNITMEWLNQKLEFNEIKQITYDKRLATYKSELFPLFEGKNIATISNAQVAKILKQKALTAATRASRLFDDLKNIFRFAQSVGYIEQNIFTNMIKHDLVPKENPKHRPKITKKKILKELVNSIYSYKGGFTIRNALKLVLHVPLRMSNLCSLTWQEVNLEKKKIVIPREKMKLKDQNLPDFEVALSDEVCNILKSQYKISNQCEYVFQNPGDKKVMNPESVNRALERMGFNDESRGRRIRVHGLRGTYRSMIDTLDKKDKFSFRAKELVLDHYDDVKSVRAYTHQAKYTKKVKKIMNFWSDFILSLRVE